MVPENFDAAPMRHFPRLSALELRIAALPCAITGPRLNAIGTYGIYEALVAYGPAEGWLDPDLPTLIDVTPVEMDHDYSWSNWFADAAA